MEQFPRTYIIRVRGGLHNRWKNWFVGMTIIGNDSDETTIEGLVRDQSELIGVINQIHNLNLTLISIICKEESV